MQVVLDFFVCSWVHLSMYSPKGVIILSFVKLSECNRIVNHCKMKRFDILYILVCIKLMPLFHSPVSL